MTTLPLTRRAGGMLSPDLDPARVNAAQTDLLTHATELTHIQLRIVANPGTTVAEQKRSRVAKKLTT